jgi:hypothetical protein
MCLASALLCGTPCEGKECRTCKSGREDLNLRPHGPEPCALTVLRYAPYQVIVRYLPRLYK